jgi:hypothetical protein
MVGEPGGHRRRGPVGQQIDGTARVDNQQDRAVVVSRAQGELVHPEHPRRVRFGSGRRRISRRSVDRLARTASVFAKRAPGPAGRRHPYLLQHLLRPGTSPPVPERESVDLLDEHGPPAGAVTTAEPPDL